MTGLNQVERRAILKQYGRWVWVLRFMPWHAAHWLAGIRLPPHERQWLRLTFADYKENNVVASRGTSKSFTHSSLAAPLKALLNKNFNVLSVSASGFRGGRLLMDDAERLFLGRLKDQTLPGPFLSASVISKNVVKREVDRWSMIFGSQSTLMTIPTNNVDNMRGIRANCIFTDERNTFPGGAEVVGRILRPMLNVGQSFARTAAGGDRNQLFQISTIDYTVRDWFPELEAMRRIAQREWESQQALREQRFDDYRRLLEEDDSALKTASISYTRVDYTDLIVPEVVEDEEGTRYRVNYPMQPDLKREDMLRWDEADKCFYWYSYPIDKRGLEEPLRQGVIDRDQWLAEQRNCWIAAAGTVYPLELIKKVSEVPIYRAGSLKDFPKADDWFGPVLMSCGDPCVIGLDYARESDFFAIVVIRLGELAEDEFDPTLTRLDSKGRVLVGRTSFNHVIWAEAWQKWTAPQAATRIRELVERYNVVANPSALLRGLGLDKGGGGTAVRDELAKPSAPTLENGEADPTWVPPLRIFDPQDEDYAHYGAYNQPEKYWGGLELLKPTNFDNLDWTGSSKGMMQAGKLYLARVAPPSEWAAEKGLINDRGEVDSNHPDYQSWNIGYVGIRRLKGQLLRLQSKISEAGTTRFVMPGDRATEEGKKDLYSAFIYAAYMARQHLQYATRKKVKADAAPAAIDIRVGGNAGWDKGWYRTMGWNV